MSTNIITEPGIFASGEDDPATTAVTGPAESAGTPSEDLPADTDAAAEGDDADQEPDDDQDDLDGDDDNGDGPGDQRGDALTRARQQAARYRTRLRDTEAERDQLRAELDGQRRAVVDWIATNGAQQFDPIVAAELLDAAGLDVNELLSEDDGHLDMAKVRDFIDATATRFHVARGFKPDRSQGASGSPVPAKPSIADAFRG